MEQEGEEDRKEEEELIEKEEGEENRKEEEHIKEEKEGEDRNKEEHIEEKEKEREEDRNQEEHIKEKERGEDMEEEEDKEEEEYDDDDDDRYDKGPLHLHEDQYAQILREVFPKATSSKPMEAEQQATSAAKHATKTTPTVLNQEQIKQMIHEAKQEILRELKEGKPDKNQATSELGVPAQNQKANFKNIIAQKIDKIKHKLKEQLKINRIVEEIKLHLKGECPLIILKVDKMMDGSRWEEIRQALSLLKCSADAVILTTTKSTQQTEGYYYPSREPIYYSLAGLYHDTVLELTKQQKNEENYNPQVFRDIMELCEPHEFCMKIFTHALYANPKRSIEELIKLHRTLKASSKSSDILAMKMFMYSYNDLPREYKSCFLYLAIFPKGQKIRRSTLTGRWVAEGLTLKDDWPSSVRQANRCFDALIHRWLVYPADIGATGKVMSCVVGDLVHGFITTIARKQHFVETRLSHHLARHFSIFNDLQLRSSDKIDKFFQLLSKSSRVSLLKVLDLEGCRCFRGGKNQRYLKDVCTKMVLLKYLSLRGTDVTQLPSEINYLRELEVLDIRQTKLPESATANILLLKLKRLLAGNIDQSSSDFGSVQVPRRIDKMVNIEVLSNVKARHHRDLKDIGKLWQLRKLGVVIKDQDHHLRHLLQEISDLHECLCSLSITTLPETTGTISLHECLRSLSTTTLPEATSDDGTPSGVELPPNISSRLQLPPKFLESLSISGTTQSGHLLPVITKDGNKLAKVTLSSTPLNQDDLNILAKLPVLQSVRLRNIACTGRLTFKEGEFIRLKYLLVEGSDLTNIIFEDGAARELAKMVLSFTSTGSISGIDKLPKLEEIELHSSSCGKLLTSFVHAEKIAKLTLSATLLEVDAIQILAQIPNIRCLVLLDKSFDGSQNQITFKDEFKWLNLLVVHCSSITEISFSRGSAPRLEKIAWSSFTISGIDKLPRLKELEFNGDDVPEEVKKAIGTKNKPSLKHNGPETHDQAKGDEEDDHDAARFHCC